MLYQSVRAYCDKQRGKSLPAILTDLTIRVSSLVLFPVVYTILAICSLIRPVKIGFLYHERLGHLALNTDLYLRRRHLGFIPRNEVHIFFVYKPANRQLVRLFARQIILINSTILSKLLAPISLLRTRFWLPLPFMGNEYADFNAAPPQISFTPEEHERGKAFLLQMGISGQQWYACIFARDHRYYEVFSPTTDLAFSDHRNADIDTYELAIQALLDAGGLVVRMGSCVEKPLSFKHPRVIDYASTIREDFADIYVTAHARMFVGTTSGASDLSVLFDVPFVGVNWMPIGYAPFGKRSIFIPKRVVRASDNQQVPIKVQLGAFTGNQVSAAIIPERILDERKWRLCDNTPEEIRDVVVEMLQRLEDRFVPDDAYLAACARYEEVLPETNIYRSNKSPMGRAMLLSLDFGNPGATTRL